MENEAENELHFNILISPVFGQIGLGRSPPIEPESSQGSSVKANITCYVFGAQKAVHFLRLGGASGSTPGMNRLCLNFDTP